MDRLGKSLLRKIVLPRVSQNSSAKIEEVRAIVNCRKQK